MLRQRGYEVTSALGFSAALDACRTGPYDLVVIGHSIPTADKEHIIKDLRTICDTSILTLSRPNEPKPSGANYNCDPGDPGALLDLIQELVPIP
jgi:DNA-binding response OmpR family regulator